MRAKIGDKTYWLDGTRRGDRGLDDLQPPDFKWALPVTPRGAALERIDQPPFARPDYEEVLHLDVSGGLGPPAPAHVEYLYRGDGAISLRLTYDSISRSDAERSLREFWTKAYPWIAVSQVGFAYDEATGVMRLSMDGAATLDWRLNGSVRDFEIGESLLGGRVSYKREPGPHQDAPYSVDYPSYAVKKVVVVLPDKGAGFSLPFGPDVDKVIAGVAYKRTSRIQDGAVTMEASERSIAPEFPSTEADSAAEALRQLADTDVVLRTARTVTPYSPTAAAPQAPPSDAAGLSAEAVVLLRNHDYAHAIADLSQAIKLQPDVSKHYYNRGVAYYEARQDDLAISDFSRTIELQPGDVLALMARGEIYLSRRDDLRAEHDFDAAEAAAPDKNRIMIRRAEAYARLHRFSEAVKVLDRAIAVASPANLPGLLITRCWQKAVWGQQLETALADCDASLKLRPDFAPALDSRGLVLLRLGRLDEAIAAYDAALRVRPGSASSLYGRGLAKMRKGLSADGAADLAAAEKASARAVAELKSYGIT